MTATAGARRVARRRPPSGGVRWDRLGRIAMLMVLLGLGYLYIGAVLSYITTYRDSQSHQAAIHRLERENTALKAQRASLLRTSTLERAARELGMIRPGERPYIIEHLPRR